MATHDAKSTSGPEVGGRKRKRAAISNSMTGKETPQDLTLTNTENSATSSGKKPKNSLRKAALEEKRLRRFRKKAPSSYLEKLDRATTQRSGTWKSYVMGLS